MALTELRPARRLAPWRLLEAVATPHGIDRYLELVHPMLTVHELRAEITDVRRRTADSVTLTLRPTRRWRGFQAGQFVQLTVEIDGVRHTRCYSPACSQYRRDGRIELTVTAHPGGLVSGHLFRHAAVGTVLGLAPAAGTFVLPNPRPERILLISGGSGITPVMSMLRTLCEQDHPGPVSLLHYADGVRDVPYLAELRALERAHDNVRVLLASTVDPEGADLRGYFGPEHLDAAAPWHAEAETFLCGPPALMCSVRELFGSRGRAAQLHVEDFQPAAAVLDDTGAGTVRFARSDLEVDSGGTLLERAESAGLTPPQGCRMGICFSCTQVKTSGCTRDIRTGETNTDLDVEVQLCVNVPVGDVVIDL
jgi:ferredoxin-NADP reductase